jgi:anti-sigma B factor antagonist
VKIDVLQTQEQVTVVTPSGRLDNANAAGLRAQLQALVDGGTVRIVVDLADVPFIDSTGLGTLIAGLKQARAGGGDLRIARPQAATMLALDLSGLNRILHPHATVEQAQAGL